MYAVIAPTEHALRNLPLMPDLTPIEDPRRGAKGTDLRRHRAITDRNLLIGFFAVLFLVGGGLIFLLYGSGAAAFGLLCIALGAVLAGSVLLIMFGLQWLSDWLDQRE